MLALTLGATSASAADNLVFNPGFESVSGTPPTPTSWTSAKWDDPAGSTTATFSLADDAHTGKYSAKIDVTTYGTAGDSKWVPQTVNVTGGKYYAFSDWYKSTANSAVSVYYETATDPVDGGHWANLFSGIAPSSTWKEYKTGFTMPTDAVRAVFVHFIAGTGTLQTDDYSVTEESAPAGYDKPMISLTFDDGSAGYWRDGAHDAIKAHGFKTTQYIPTGGYATNDPFLMTPAQIQALHGEGNEIGSHSSTHPDLTKLTDSLLDGELTQPKSYLESIPGIGPVTSFAYPFGAYDARVIDRMKAAGYRSGRSVEPGYNSKLDLERFDIRVQNMTSPVALKTADGKDSGITPTTLADFKKWVDYAKAHNYWLVIVYHEVVPDGAPVCPNPTDLADPPAPAAAYPENPDPCLGLYHTRLSDFKAQLDYITASGLASNVLTVQEALDAVGAPAATPGNGTGSGPAVTPNPASSAPQTPPAPPVTRDKKAPKIEIKAPKKSGAYRRHATVRARYTCSDDVRVAKCTGTVKSGGKLNTRTRGTKRFRVVARDVAGNVATKTVTYRVK